MTLLSSHQPLACAKTAGIVNKVYSTAILDDETASQLFTIWHPRSMDL